MSKTSWESSNQWYHQCVGGKGHYFHQKLIFPLLKKICKITPKSQVLDLGCGQGVLARNIAKNCHYTGVDLSKSLIQAAQKQSNNPFHQFICSDVTKKLPIKSSKYDFAFIVLAIQNIEDQEKAIYNASKHIKENGQLVIVLNHPCFRIPQHSSWDINREKKLQSRKIDHYLSFLKIPILTNPSKREKSAKTFSYHYPLQQYFLWLQKSSFLIENCFELSSDKKSTGKYAKMEDRARKEFPLFFCMTAKKQKR